MQIINKFWNDIKRGENIDLYLTISVAFGVGLLNIFGVAPQSLVMPIILTILGLLAISALKNDYRNQELLQIVSKADTRAGLRGRSQMASLEASVNTASEIIVVAVSGISLFSSHMGVFERKLKEGCNLKVLLLKPNSPAVKVWDFGVRGANTDSDIVNSLIVLKELAKVVKAENQLEIRLLPVFPPFSIFAVDSEKRAGTMIVEPHLFKTPLTERPHILLTRSEDDNWFDSFLDQFHKMWDDAEVWNPS